MIDEKIIDMLEQKKYLELKKKLSEVNPVDISEILEKLDPQRTLLLFRLLSKNDAVEVFANISNEKKLELTNSFTEKEIIDVINELMRDDMVDMLEEMPANVVNKILKNTSEKERKEINTLLNYPEYSAGSLMTTEYIELSKNITVSEALEIIKETGINKETIYTCYITDDSKKLIGFISLRKIVTSPSSEILENLMEEEVISVNTHDDQEFVAGVFRKYGFVVLPVVDNENRMCGIITVDDIVDVIDQEATEDFQRMAAMAPNEDEYLNTSVFELAKHRITWLLVLMISATFTGKIMQRYSDIIAQVIALNMFIPMIMDSGGNAGSQSSTLVIRGLATGDISTRDWIKVFMKELKVSLGVGFVMAIVCFMKVIFIDKIHLNIAILVSITLMFTIMLAKIVGGILPIIAKKLKLDPAIMAGPLITTIVDAMGLLLYFGLAKVILGI